MLTQTLDTVEEPAGFDTPPDGEYTLIINDAKIDSYKDKATGVDVPRLKIIYAVAATIATASGEQPVADGTLFSETFQGTEQGLGYFKKRIKEILAVDDVSGVTLGDMMESAKGTIIDARLSTKKTPKKDAPGEFWENLNIKIVKK